MILIMHLSALQDLGKVGFIWELMTRWAVPFYFVTSAYFLFRKGHDGNISRTDLIKYLKRIAMLYLCWFIINLPSTFYIRLLSKGILSWKTWLYFFVTAILSSTFTGSWYLTSCMFCAAVIYLLCKKLRTGVVLIISFCIQLICVLSSAYAGLLPAAIHTVLARLSFPLNLFGGLFYFALGKFLAEKEHIFDRLNLGACIFFVFLFLAFYFLEIYLSKLIGIYETSDQALSLMPLSLFLFLACQRFTFSLRNAKVLRKMSTIIYCCQSNILVFVSGSLKLLGVTASLVRLPLGIMLVTAVILVVFWLQKNKNLKWARYLT